MNKFYTDVSQKFGTLLVTGYKNGHRFRERIDIKPDVYIASNSNNRIDARTMDGQILSRIPTSDLNDARQMIKEYEGQGIDLYYNPRFAQAQLRKSFKEQVVDTSIIRCGYLDIEIEVESSSGFPSISDPIERVNAITLGIDYGKRTEYHVFSLGKFDSSQVEHIRDTRQEVKTYEFDDERMLLREFLRIWVDVDLDVVSGWNIETFDIPYLYNRMKKLFGEDAANRLSPWNYVDERNFSGRFGDDEMSLTVAGISMIDYLQLYRKFQQQSSESFSLGFIAQEEIGATKLEGGYTLYRTNFQRHVQYNLRDVELVIAINDKLKLLDLVFALAYDAFCFYSNVFSQVTMWDCITCNRLLEGNIIPMGTRRNRSSSGLVGGYVKDGYTGLSEWVVSFDVNSEYPSLIIMFNMSPDSIVKGDERVAVLESWLEHHHNHGNKESERIIRKIYDGAWTVDDIDLILSCPTPVVPDNNRYTMTAKGIIFRKDKPGVLAQLMQEKSDNRVKYKKMMIAEKKKAVAIEAILKSRGVTV